MIHRTSCSLDKYNILLRAGDGRVVEYMNKIVANVRLIVLIH